MQMLSQVSIWLSQLIHNACSVLHLKISLGIIHVIDIILLLESLLSILLVFKYLGKNTFGLAASIDCVIGGSAVLK